MDTVKQNVDLYCPVEVEVDCEAVLEGCETFELDGSASADSLAKPDLCEKTPSSSSSSLICCCLPASWIFLPDDEDETVVIQNSHLATVFLLLNTMIGSGIVVQPYVFSQAGVVVTLWAYLIIGVMIYFGVDMLIRAAEKVGIYHYSEVAEKVLGPYGRVVVDLSIVINNAGALLSYILIVGSLAAQVIDTIVYGTCSTSHWYCHPAFLTVFPIVFFTVPLCLIRSFGHLAIISYVSIAVIAAIVLLVVVGGPVERVYYEHNSHNQVVLGSFYGMMSTIGDIVFAMGYITAIFHAFHGMKNKSIYHFTKAAMQTTGCGVLMCLLTGLVGYLSFLDETDTNIVSNFSGPVGAVFQTALIVHLVLYIPGDFVIMRSALWKLFRADVAKQSDWSFVLTTLALIITITLIAIFLQIFAPNENSLGMVVNITGGVAGSILYFLMPGLCVWRLFPEEQVLCRVAKLLILFGLVILALVLVGSAI